MLKITLGEKIKQKRLEKNISRAELSRLSGVPLRTIENWEYGSRKPTSLNVLKVCEILEININEYN